MFYFSLGLCELLRRSLNGNSTPNHNLWSFLVWCPEPDVKVISGTQSNKEPKNLGPYPVFALPAKLYHNNVCKKPNWVKAMWDHFRNSLYDLAYAHPEHSRGGRFSIELSFVAFADEKLTANEEKSGWPPSQEQYAIPMSHRALIEHKVKTDRGKLSQCPVCPVLIRKIVQKYRQSYTRRRAGPQHPRLERRRRKGCACHRSCPIPRVGLSFPHARC